MGLLFRLSLKRKEKKNRRGRGGEKEEGLVLTEYSLHAKHFAWIILFDHLNNLKM